MDDEEVKEYEDFLITGLGEARLLHDMGFLSDKELLEVEDILLG
jgi:hypothetical protein